MLIHVHQTIQLRERLPGLCITCYQKISEPAAIRQVGLYWSILGLGSVLALSIGGLSASRPGTCGALCFVLFCLHFNVASFQQCRLFYLPARARLALDHLHHEGGMFLDCVVW